MKTRGNEFYIYGLPTARQYGSLGLRSAVTRQR